MCKKKKKHIPSSTMQNTESGRKLNQAMASTGRAVATTGKAVGKFNIYIHMLLKIYIYIALIKF